jgi:hypothetical protein
VSKHCQKQIDCWGSQHTPAGTDSSSSTLYWWDLKQQQTMDSNPSLPLRGINMCSPQSEVGQQPIDCWDGQHFKHPADNITQHMSYTVGRTNSVDSKQQQRRVDSKQQQKLTPALFALWRGTNRCSQQSEVGYHLTVAIQLAAGTAASSVAVPLHHSQGVYVQQT